MNPSRLSHAQLRQFSECLDMLYSLPTGEDPVDAVLTVLMRLTRISSMAVDEFKLGPNGGMAHQHVTSRGFEGHPEVAVIPRLVMKDHPLIKHASANLGPEPLRMSDFVSQRELQKLSIYDFNSKIHEGWCDQMALRTRVAGGTMNITLNRDRVFTDEEFFLFDLLMPHIRRVINRCALYIRLPGNDQLTPREREVLYWMTKGKRDEEIAVIISSAPRTVSKQVQTILAKLGVENRTSAVAMVLTREPKQ
ncbi:MAG: helix-turn-helix transcriptional regulator [Verrucomicrobiaceae bacterium]|nr:helix-turn-helix transcriptional regulator [Verrucomicrobiaceae bacterium]